MALFLTTHIAPSGAALRRAAIHAGVTVNDLCRTKAAVALGGAVIESDPFPAAVNGNVALVERGGQIPRAKADVAMKVWATAMILVNTTGDETPFRGTLGYGSARTPLAVGVTASNGAAILAHTGPRAPTDGTARQKCLAGRLIFPRENDPRHRGWRRRAILSKRL